MVNVTPRPLYLQENRLYNLWRSWFCPMAVLDGCGKPPPHRDSIHRKVEIKNCLKVTNKHKTKNTVDKTNKLMNLKYLSSFRPLVLTVWPLLPTDCRCRGLQLYLTVLGGTTHTHTHTHTCGRVLLDEGSEFANLKRHDIHMTCIFMSSAGFETAIQQTHASEQLEKKNTKCCVILNSR